MTEELPILENKCGTCQACCEIMGVHELEKQDHTVCEHQCEAGCAIYKDRPKECDTYACFWLTNGNFSEEFRPNNLRVILEISDSAWGKMLYVRELDEGAAKEEKARNFIDYVADKAQAFIVVIYKRSRYLVFPPHSKHVEERVKIFYEHWENAKKKKEEEENTDNLG